MGPFNISLYISMHLINLTHTYVYIYSLQIPPDAFNIKMFNSFEKHEIVDEIY